MDPTIWQIGADTFQQKQQEFGRKSLGLTPAEKKQMQEFGADAFQKKRDGPTICLLSSVKASTDSRSLIARGLMLSISCLTL